MHDTQQTRRESDWDYNARRQSEQQEIDQHEEQVASTGKEESPEHVKVEKEEQEREPQHAAHHPQHGGCCLQITCGQIGDERRDENHHRPYQKQHQKQRYVFLTYSFHIVCKYTIF